MKARRIGGLMTLAVFLALVAADTVHPAIVLEPDDKILLVSMVGTLLGVDILTKRWSVIRAAVTAGLRELETNGTQGEDDDGR